MLLSLNELPRKICIQEFGKENHAMAMPAFLYPTTGWIVMSEDWMETNPPHEEKVRAFIHELAALHLNWVNDTGKVPEVCLIPHDHESIGALVEKWLKLP